MNVDCPFCAFSDVSITYVTDHIEHCHLDDRNDILDSVHDTGHFGLESDVSLNEVTVCRDACSEVKYIQCECGDLVQLTEFTSHLAIHFPEEITVDSAPPEPNSYRASSIYAKSATGSATDADSRLRASSGSRKPVNHHRSSERKAQQPARGITGIFLGSHIRQSISKSRHLAPRRLGTAELGPYAYENQMPSWLRKQLETGAKPIVGNNTCQEGCVIPVEMKANETSGMIPVLGMLCQQDKSVSKAYLSHPGVQHIVKMAREGGFCGYRNIQMMISFIRAAKSDGYQHFMKSIPSVIELQDAIERAWDRGINDFGRIETGGIKGTRKFIGTSEAQALFIYHEIGCEATAFCDSKEVPGYLRVLRAVESYFLGGVADSTEKVCWTSLPPLYFQYPGHSVTIVGLEKLKSGSYSLLVLDPMFKPSHEVGLLLRGNQNLQVEPGKLLGAYRRGEGCLKRYSKFELLKLTRRHI